MASSSLSSSTTDTLLSCGHSVSRSKELLACARTTYKVYRQQQQQQQQQSSATAGVPPPAAEPIPTFRLASMTDPPPESLSILEDGLTLLRSMEYGLKQLKVLVRRRGATNDPTNDISTLVKQLEQDTTELTEFCQSLLSIRRRKQAKRHYELIVEWFQHVAMTYSSQVKESMKLRSEILAEQAQQRRRLVDSKKTNMNNGGSGGNAAGGGGTNGTSNGSSMSSATKPTSAASRAAVVASAPIFDSPLFTSPQSSYRTNRHKMTTNNNGTNGYYNQQQPQQSQQQPSSSHGRTAFPPPPQQQQQQSQQQPSSSNNNGYASSTTSLGSRGGGYGGASTYYGGGAGAGSGGGGYGGYHYGGSTGGYGGGTSSSSSMGMRQRRTGGADNHNNNYGSSTSTSIPIQEEMEEEQKIHSQIQMRKHKRQTQERLENAREAETMLGELGQMFSKMSNLISQQGETLEKIEDDIEGALVDVTAGQEELTKLYGLKKGNRPLIIKTFLILNFLIIFMKAYSRR